MFEGSDLGSDYSSGINLSADFRKIQSSVGIEVERPRYTYQETVFKVGNELTLANRGSFVSIQGTELADNFSGVNAETIFGNGGADVLFSMADKSKLHGGQGDDRFLVKKGSRAVDSTIDDAVHQLCRCCKGMALS